MKPAMSLLNRNLNIYFFPAVFAFIQIIVAGDVKSILNGGSPVGKHEFPWMLGLINKSTGKLFCGASILTEVHLITSGRCVHEWFNETTTKKVEPGSIKVIAGDNNRMEDEGSEQTVDVLDIIVYPGFSYDEQYKPQSGKVESGSDGSRRKGFQNDLAILVVSPPLNFTDDVKPIKLVDESLNYGEMIFLSGWGITDKKQNTIPTGKSLKKVQIEYSNEAKSSGKFGLYSNSTNGEVIEFNTGIGNNKGLMGRCIGDPGAAVVCQTSKGQDYYLCGVISFGIWCDRYYPTGQFIGVKEYMGWINSIISSNLWAYVTFSSMILGILALLTTGIVIRRRRNSY